MIPLKFHIISVLLFSFLLFFLSDSLSVYLIITLKYLIDLKKTWYSFNRLYCTYYMNHHKFYSIFFLSSKVKTGKVLARNSYFHSNIINTKVWKKNYGDSDPGSNILCYFEKINPKRVEIKDKKQYSQATLCKSAIVICK